MRKNFGQLRMGLTAALLCSCLATACLSQKSPPGDHNSSARSDMVEQQIVARGVSDKRVIDAMSIVPRHLFVPQLFKAAAYADRPLPIGFNQTISQPYIVAYMTEKLNLKPNSRVLEIGTGSGYQVAVLAHLAKEVYSIEIVEPLGKRAKNLLASLGYKNVFVRLGDGYAGWPDKAPFDAVIVTAAADHIPQALIDQLKVGGTLVIPIGTDWQDLIRVTRTASGVKNESLLPVVFVPLTRKH